MFSEIKIAMWSGPRNLSTAMMRSFENRADCRVWDEPYYAAYLRHSGEIHPMNDAIINANETDPQTVAAECVASVQNTEQRYFYQKHMPHHMLNTFELAWLKQVRSAFLIREPERVLASYAAKRDQVKLEDLGYPQQLRIFQMVCDQLGKAPPVIEAEDVRRNPTDMMPKLCEALSMPFDKAMLSWPAGSRDSDGVWAAHWYKSVEQSTCFQPLPEVQNLPTLPDDLQRIADEARPLFDALQQHKLTTTCSGLDPEPHSTRHYL